MEEHQSFLQKFFKVEESIVRMKSEMQILRFYLVGQTIDPGKKSGSMGRLDEILSRYIFTLLLPLHE